MASHAGDGELGFQIAPMLDILFVLLLFFMVSAGAQKHEAGIRVPLPGKGPGPGVAVNLEITPEGEILFNGAPTDLPVMTSRLAAVVADAPDRPIIIRPAPSTHQQRVVDVLNACTAAHAKNIAFAALDN